jgi:voltage-gated potassium channel
MLTLLRTHLRDAVAGLSGKAWFPQVPVSLGVALLGLLHLIPVIDQTIGLYLHLRTPGSVRQDLVGINLSDISQLSISVLLLIMSVGLWLRSRIAWLLSVLATAIGLASLYLLSEIQVGAWLFGYDIVLMGLLLATYRHFNRSNMRIGTLVALAAVGVLFGYAVLGTYHLGDQFSPHIDTLIDAVYVSVVTMSTVGFGDFKAITPETRLFMVSIILLSIILLSTAVGATLIPAMVRKIEQITVGRNIKMIRINHYIIVGYSALSANTYRELVSRHEQVTVILRDDSDGALFPATDPDIVVGDGSDLETLREAGAEKAKAILALMDDDSENAFVILAAKELKTKARTVAAVNQAKHLNRIRRVHPDLIIAPQVLGGELLTSLLVGERIDVKVIMDRLLGHSDTRPPSGKANG